jgi:hypothetical protein
MKNVVIGVLAISLFSQSAVASVCDHKPSRFIAGAIAAPGIVGAGMQAAGLYVFPHAAGITMLGSTAAGSSAAGTVGIIGGTGGAIGTVGAALMSPAAIGAAVVVGGGAIVYEGACYLSSKNLESHLPW